MYEHILLLYVIIVSNDIRFIGTVSSLAFTGINYRINWNQYQHKTGVND